MLLDEKIESLQNLTKKKITYDKIAEVLGLGSKQAAYNRITRKTPLKPWEENALNEAFLKDCKQADLIEIEHIHINPSCGNGTIILDEPEITPIKLGRKMIETILRVSDVNNLKTFTASGDSMEDTIDDGNLLLVDLGRKDYTNGGIFVITINNDWYVKRLRKRINGELDVISDNSAKYPVETYTKKDNIEIVIKGRVIKNLSKGL